MTDIILRPEGGEDELYRPSITTTRLIRKILQRDAFGRQKYGMTLDRPDLDLGEWAVHAVEEMLDGAGYMLRVADEFEGLAADAMRAANQSGK